MRQSYHLCSLLADKPAVRCCMCTRTGKRHIKFAPGITKLRRVILRLLCVAERGMIFSLSSVNNKLKFR